MGDWLSLLVCHANILMINGEGRVEREDTWIQRVLYIILNGMRMMIVYSGGGGGDGGAANDEIENEEVSGKVIHFPK